MIENEIERMLREFDQQLQAQGLNLDLYSQFSGQDKDALKDSMKQDAEKRVRASLTIEAIADAENIEVTEEEVNQELEKMSEMYNMPAEQIKQLLGGSTDSIKNDLRFIKLFNFLLKIVKKLKKWKKLKKSLQNNYMFKYGQIKTRREFLIVPCFPIIIHNVFLHDVLI